MQELSSSGNTTPKELHCLDHLLVSNQELKCFVEEFFRPVSTNLARANKKVFDCSNTGTYVHYSSSCLAQ